MNIIKETLMPIVYNFGAKFIKKGLVKDHCIISYRYTINYTNKPESNFLYNLAYIKIPNNYNYIKIQTNNSNNLGQANSFIIFTNGYNQFGIRIANGVTTNITISLNHNYKYIAFPMGVNDDFTRKNNFYSFDTTTFEFIK